jgi:hypothetical protein
VRQLRRVLHDLTRDPEQRLQALDVALSRMGLIDEPVVSTAGHADTTAAVAAADRRLNLPALLEGTADSQTRTHKVHRHADRKLQHRSQRQHAALAAGDAFLEQVESELAHQRRINDRYVRLATASLDAAEGKGEALGISAQAAADTAQTLADKLQQQHTRVAAEARHLRARIRATLHEDSPA